MLETYLLSDFNYGGGIAAQVKLISEKREDIKILYKEQYLNLIFYGFKPANIIVTSLKGLPFGILKKLLNKKSKLIYIVYHHQIIDRFTRGYIVANLLKKSFQFCDLIIPHDKSSLNSFINTKYRLSKYLMGLGCERYSNFNFKDRRNDHTELLWVSRLVEFKIPALLKLIELVQKNKKINLTIIGEGDMEHNLKKKFSNCKRIKFMGYKPIKYIIKKSNESDITFGMATTLLILMQMNSLAIACYANSSNFYIPSSDLQFNYMEEPLNQKPISIDQILNLINENYSKELISKQKKIYKTINNNFYDNLDKIILEINQLNYITNLSKRFFDAVCLLILLSIAGLIKIIISKPSL